MDHRPNTTTSRNPGTNHNQVAQLWTENLALQPCTLHPYTHHAREGTEQPVTQQWLYDSKNNTSSSYLSEEAEYYTQRSLTQHYIKQRKSRYAIRQSKISKWPKRPWTNNMSQLFLLLSQAAEWEPQATRRSRSRRRNHHYLSNRLVVENINEARLSTGHTQQDLVRLLTICGGSKGFLWSLLRKASFHFKRLRTRHRLLRSL